MEFKKDQEITVTITDMGSDGEGIGKTDGFPLFIKDAVIGDVVRVKIMKAKKGYAFARLLEILTPSVKRTEPRCAMHRQCGGCQIQALDYKEQLAYKENKVRNNLQRIGGIDEALLQDIMEPIIGMEEPYGYRNKAQYPVGTDRDGQLVAGFYAGRTHAIIPCTDCSLGPVESEQILSKVLAYMKKNNVRAYDEATERGLVRHVLVRKGFATGELMVCLVINGKQIPHPEELAESLNEIPGMTSIMLNSNTEKTNVILGTRCILIDGRDYITDVLMGLTFRISPLAFYQVNPLQTRKLYETALEYAGLTGSEEVWDICCGIGTITLAMAAKAARVHGLEIVPEAIADAMENARINHIENAEFITAPAEEYMPAHKDEIQADVIVVDPPRKGMDPAALEAMVTVSPKRIVYVSCDSATLARDLKYLLANGYALQHVQTVDMFPHTVHVETVCCLQRVNM